MHAGGIEHSCGAQKSFRVKIQIQLEFRLRWSFRGIFEVENISLNFEACYLPNIYVLVQPSRYQ